MEIMKVDGGFAIRFPYPLKDAFRAAFPSARWNAREKQWEVGPRSGKRLEQWVAEAQAAAEQIEAQQELDLAIEELDRVRWEIAKVAGQSRELEALRAETAAARAALHVSRIELEAAGQVRRETEAALNRERDQIARLLSSAIDLAAVRDACRVMAANMVPSDRTRKARFEEAREIVKTQRDVLAKSGIACAAINALAGANVNRPDRDHPRDIPDGAWYRIWKIEDEDE